MESDRVQGILREAGIAVAYLFGSRATERHGPSSDADIAVLPERDLGLLERERLAARLAGEFDVTDVDVLVLEEAPLELRGRVVQEGRLLYSADESRRVAFEARTRTEYLDFLPSLEPITRAYLRRVAEEGLARG